MMMNSQWDSSDPKTKSIFELIEGLQRQGLSEAQVRGRFANLELSSGDRARINQTITDIFEPAPSERPIFEVQKEPPPENEIKTLTDMTFQVASDAGVLGEGQQVPSAANTSEPSFIAGFFDRSLSAGILGVAAGLLLLMGLAIHWSEESHEAQAPSQLVARASLIKNTTALGMGPIRHSSLRKGHKTRTLARHKKSAPAMPKAPTSRNQTYVKSSQDQSNFEKFWGMPSR